MKFIVETDVAVPATDGTALLSDVYRPDDDERHPVLLCRTPYGKSGVLVSVGMMNAPILTWAARGYIVVVQDCRGTGLSEGEFRFMRDEASDGVDAIAWCAGEPWSSGLVGMFGSSYLSSTQFTAAFERPSALKAISPSVAPSGAYGQIAYRGGAFCLATSLEWTQQRVVEQHGRHGLDPTSMPAALDLLMRTPLTAVTELDGTAGAHYSGWLAHPDRDASWEPVNYDGRYELVTTPSLHVAGWYDVFLGGTIDNYLHLRDHADGAEARSHQQLVIGPWTHMNQTGRFEGRDYGATAPAPAGIHALQFDHFDRWLTTREVAPIGNPVHLFVMGIDEWRSEPSWPLPNTDYRPLYLCASDSGEGGEGLSFERPATDRPPSSYAFDPNDPVPTLGGATLISYLSSEGPSDQRANDDRDDVLSFVGSALTDPLEVTGPVAMIAYVSASTTDTDLTATLIDVHPDGRAELLTDGILRLRYRNSLSTPEPLEPGTVYEVRIDMWATSNVFLPGHRIRVDVSSSNFPRYDRNSNTGGMIAAERLPDMLPATVSLHHSSKYSTHVLLPVIPAH